MVLGVGRDELPGHELQVRLGPPRRVGRGNVAGQSQHRAKPPLRVGFVIAQQAAEPLGEPGRGGTSKRGIGKTYVTLPVSNSFTSGSACERSRETVASRAWSCAASRQASLPCLKRAVRARARRRRDWRRAASRRQHLGRLGGHQAADEPLDAGGLLSLCDPVAEDDPRGTTAKIAASVRADRQPCVRAAWRIVFRWGRSSARSSSAAGCSPTRRATADGGSRAWRSRVPRVPPAAARPDPGGSPAACGSASRGARVRGSRESVDSRDVVSGAAISAPSSCRR